MYISISQKDFIYKITGDVAVIVRYVGEKTYVIVPRSYFKNGKFYRVVGIGCNAFANMPICGRTAEVRSSYIRESNKSPSRVCLER